MIKLQNDKNDSDMFLITNETNNFVVVQSNELVEASYSPELTTRAHKVARFILSLISPEDNDLKLYTVPVSTLKSFLGYKENTTWGSFYPEIKDIADRLNKEPIIIKSDDKVTTAYFIAGYEIDVGSRTVTFEVSLLLKPYLLALKRNFTRYPLNYISQLRSAYSIRLYELLCQYKNIGHRTFELNALQLLLGSNYEFYGNFKDKVLAIAKRDLITNTDIDFDYTEIKTARRVTGIRFTIFTNKSAPAQQPSEKTELLLPENEDGIQVFEGAFFTPQTTQALVEWGMKPTAIDKYQQQGFAIIAHEKQREQAALRCNNSLEAYYSEKLAICQQSKKTPKNRVGFLVKALQEDWQESKSTALKTQSENKKPVAAPNEPNKRQQEAHMMQLKKQLTPIKQAIFEDIIASDTEGFLEIFEFVKGTSGAIKNTVFPPNSEPMELFRNNGMASNLLKIRIEELYPDRFEDLNRRLKAVSI
jgi:plasmid replication initiation protein